MNQTYAQNLRLRKIQNRRFAGQDIFNIGKRGEPIPGKMDPVTLARKQRRALKRPENLTKRLKGLEHTIMWHQKRITEIEKGLKETPNNPKAMEEHRRHTTSVELLQAQTMLVQQSLNALS